MKRIARDLARDFAFMFVVGFLTIMPLNLLSRAAYGHSCEPWWLTQVAWLVALLWTAHRWRRTP